MTGPVVGITCDYGVNDRGKERSFVYSSYYDALVAAGAVPVLLPALTAAGDVDRLLDRLDGVLLTGGDDYTPDTYGGPEHPAVAPVHPRRQGFDLLLGAALLERDLPVLGVCCGLQLMAIVGGGTIYEDVPSQVPDAIAHRGEGGRLVDHEVATEPGTRLAGLLGPTGTTNSKHHQSVRDPGPWRVAARSSDGLIEALEGVGDRFWLGVQWHPELIPDRPAGGGVLAAFVEAAAVRPAGRRPT